MFGRGEATENEKQDGQRHKGMDEQPDKHSNGIHSQITESIHPGCGDNPGDDGEDAEWGEGEDELCQLHHYLEGRLEEAGEA